MDLRRLRYFVTLAEELNFGRAALRLHLSQPSLSLQIQTLEGELGVKLFDRDRHKVSLSAAGDAALVEAYRTLQQADRVKVAATKAAAGVVEKLSLGCVQSALFSVLPTLLDRLQVLEPTAKVYLADVESSAGITAILQGKLDAAILRTDYVEKPLVQKRLMPDHFILAIPERHRLATHEKIELHELQDQPLIVFARQLFPSAHDAVTTACRAIGFDPLIEYHCTSIQSQIGLVSCGMGVAVVPRHTSLWQVPRVVYRELQTPLRATSLTLVWSERSRMGLLDKLVSVAREDLH